MGSVPQHPFFLRVIELLQSYDRHWLLPYITVMYSTGPLFLSVLWKEYMIDKPGEAGRVRILMQDEYNKYSWSFFTHHVGNSWHGKDAQLIFWVSHRKLLLIGNDILTAVDGATLVPYHSGRLRCCRCCRSLCLVDLYPIHVVERQVPVWVPQDPSGDLPPCTVTIPGTVSGAHTAPPSQLQRRRRICSRDRNIIRTLQQTRLRARAP